MLELVPERDARERPVVLDLHFVRWLDDQVRDDGGAVMGSRVRRLKRVVEGARLTMMGWQACVGSIEVLADHDEISRKLVEPALDRARDLLAEAELAYQVAVQSAIDGGVTRAYGIDLWRCVDGTGISHNMIGEQIAQATTEET